MKKEEENDATRFTHNMNDYAVKKYSRGAADATMRAAPPGETRDSPLERFGLQVRLRRKRAGYPLLEFAEKTGIAPETLVAIEYGFADYDQVCAHLACLAQGLALPPAALARFLTSLFAPP